MTAAQAITHPWLTSNAAGSSNINLHRTISHNLIHRQQSTRANSTRSNKSNGSSKSNRSTRSLRSEHRRVLPEEIEQLHKDPDFVAELTSISSNTGDSNSSHGSNNSRQQLSKFVIYLSEVPFFLRFSICSNREQNQYIFFASNHQGEPPNVTK